MILLCFRRHKAERQRIGGGLGDSPGQRDLCVVCRKKPKDTEKNGLLYQYCGRSCARTHQPPCKYPACDAPSKPAFSGYCGFGHARDAVQNGLAVPCTECGKQPEAIGDLCLGCHSPPSKSTEPRLKELNLQDPTAASLIDNFNHLWKGSESVSIGRIYEIRLPPHMAKIREAYHSKLAAVENPYRVRTFHSRLCICDLGTNGTQFCIWSSCGICAIIKSAFGTFELGVKSNSGRFGPGIYSYLEPSLADRWATSTTSSPYRVMLACEVNLIPPQAKPSESPEILQSHEEGPLVFVSGAEAITPQYLILYSNR